MAWQLCWRGAGAAARGQLLPAQVARAPVERLLLLQLVLHVRSALSLLSAQDLEVCCLIELAANTGTPVSHWWAAGGRELLVVQPVDDAMAVAENARQIVDEFGDHATLVLVPEAGHALLPEQPEAVAKALLDWLGKWN